MGKSSWAAATSSVAIKYPFARVTCLRQTMGSLSVRLTFGRHLDKGRVRQEGDGVFPIGQRGVCGFHRDVIRAKECLNGPPGAAKMDLEALNIGQVDSDFLQWSMNS